MSFQHLFHKHQYFLYDGPMETRIEYGTSIKLDKEMSIFRLTENDTGREALAKLYRTDIETVMPFNLPIILNAPTFRASKEHCQRLGIAQNIDQINQHCIDLVKNIRTEYPQYQEHIFITAPIGPKYAGFTPDNINDLQTEINYHREQIDNVAKIGVDLISIAAMPGAMETIGATIAASETCVDYTVGFVLTKDATLLDGVAITDVIRKIDAKTNKKPLGYIVACTHPSVAEQALAANKPEYQRFIGIKANGSAKPPKDLVKLTKPEADEPMLFAQELLALGNAHHFKIYGGCCGTDHTHLKALAELLS